MANNMNTCLTIGVCNEPSMLEFRERLIYILSIASRANVYLIIQTKNPAIILSAIQEAKVDTRRIRIRTSCSDSDTTVIEAGAPKWSERVKTLLDCAK